MNINIYIHTYIHYLSYQVQTCIYFLQLSVYRFSTLPVRPSYFCLLTALCSVVHLSEMYPIVKGLSALLFGTLFLNRSALLILSLFSDPELKLTFSVLLLNSFNLSAGICVSHPLISSIVDKWMFFHCFVIVILFCNNVL